MRAFNSSRSGRLALALLLSSIFALPLSAQLKSVSDIDLGANNGRIATAPRVTLASLSSRGCNSIGELVYATDASSGNHLYASEVVGSPCTWVQQGIIQPHPVTFVFNGGTTVISTGDIVLYPGNGANTGTINRVDISGAGSGGATCSITVDIWKRNANIPTSGQKISASAPATLSTANLSQSGSLSGWTTSVAANDVWGASVASVTGCLTVLVQVWYQ